MLFDDDNYLWLYYRLWCEIFWYFSVILLDLSVRILDNAKRKIFYMIYIENIFLSNTHFQQKC
jgi:hypothetical protein